MTTEEYDNLLELNISYLKTLDAIIDVIEKCSKGSAIEAVKNIQAKYADIVHKEFTKNGKRKG